jgi:predicted RNA methylase
MLLWSRSGLCAKPHEKLVDGGNVRLQSKCDQIWENPPYGIRARFAQSTFLVAQVEICQSPHFVIYMSSNPSSNCSHHLRRLVGSYHGEISLHFDPPSLYSRRVQIPLLREIIKIRARGLPRYTRYTRYSLFRRTTVCSLAS